jgi:hypothetical protein
MFTTFKLSIKDLLRRVFSDPGGVGPNCGPPRTGA